MDNSESAIKSFNAAVRSIERTLLKLGKGELDTAWAKDSDIQKLYRAISRLDSRASDLRGEEGADERFEMCSVLRKSVNPYRLCGARVIQKRRDIEIAMLDDQIREARRQRIINGLEDPPLYRY